MNLRRHYSDRAPRREVASAKCLTPAGAHETNHGSARRGTTTCSLAICVRILSCRGLRKTESDKTSAKQSWPGVIVCEMQRGIHVGRVRREQTRQRTRAYVLADLLRAVRTASKNDLEAIAVIVHLVEHGRVRIIDPDREVRVRIC
jgi:hypothetical protein